MSIVKDLFEKGLKNRVEEFAKEEEGKAGNLRGGSCGIVSNSEVIGTCPRRAYLRMKGVEVDPPPPNRELMFAAGRLNEDAWMDALKRSWDGPILAEEEVGTKWLTKNGTPVTGRPDIVLCSQGPVYEAVPGCKDTEMVDVKPEVGIELKLVSSLWTARDVLFEGKPKFMHLIQAAHYSWQLNIPFELWYTSRADFVTNDMANRCLPKYGSEKWNILSKHLEFRHYKKVKSRNGNVYGKQISEDQFRSEEAEGNYGFSEGQVYVSPLKILPFAVGYVLHWEEDGRLSYQSTEFGDKVKTRITKDAIRSYYEFVSKMEEENKLGPRPLTLKGDGEPANYSQCSYCPLQKTCDANPNATLSDWVKKIEV